MKNFFEKFTTACWIPDMYTATTFIEHLRVNRPTLNFHIVTDGPVLHDANFKVITVPKFGEFKNMGYARYNKISDRYAFWAFVSTFKRLSELGFEWMMWLETDCRVRGVSWDHCTLKVMEQTESPLVGGTPVIWHPWSRGITWSLRTIEFAYIYQRAAGVPMLLEGALDGPCGYNCYPNGAFGVYWIPDLIEFFSEALDLLNNKPTVDQMEYMAALTSAFDYYIGQKLVKKYGLSLLDRFVCLPWIYSGCGDSIMNEGERWSLLRHGAKVGIHQIKTQLYA